MSVGRRLIGDTLIYGIALAVSRAVTFALLPVFTRVFTVAEYGSYDLATSLTRALFVPAVLGIDVGVALMVQQRDSVGQGRAVSSALTAQIAWAGLVTVAALALAPQLSELLFRDLDHASLIRLAVLFLAVLIVNNFAMAVLKWKREPWRYLALAIASSGLAAALSLYFVLVIQGGASGALIGLSLGAGICVPLAIVLLVPHLGGPISSDDMRDALRIGLPFSAVSAGEFVFPFLLRLILSSTAGLAAVGVFGALNTICLGLTMVNDAFASAWWPYMLSTEAHERAQGDTAAVMRLYAFFLIVLAAGLALLARPLVTLLLGGGIYLEAAAVVAPLALAYWTKSIRQNVNVSLVLAKRNWARAALNMLTLAVSLGLALPLTIQWGVEGAAWGFAGGEALGLALQAGFMSRLFALHVEMRAPAIMAIAFLALAAIEVALPVASLAVGTLERAGLLTLFVAVLLLLRVAAPRELGAVARVVLRLARPHAPHG
jgi:O-antigen/teichoic acid export membrane protein